MALPNEPITRQEMYLSNIAGQNTALPDAPITREEMYLDYIAKNGGTGEGDMKKSIYDSDNAVATAGGIKMFVNQKIGTLPQRVGSLETTAGVLQGEVVSIENTLGTLGTASTKNSTSVVTDSTDLVESGAVYDVVGWGNKNKFNYNAWKGIAISRGTGVFENNGVTLTATETDAFSAYELPFYSENAKIPVEEGKTIKLTWDCDEIVQLGTVYIFPNGTATGAVSVNNLAKQLEYTPTEGITFITFRVGVSFSGNTIHYKNIMVSASGGAYESYHASVSDSLADKADNSVIGTVEDGTTASQAYAVGSHAIRNGKFITWINAKAQGETINDASDYTSGDVADLLTRSSTFTLSDVFSAYGKVSDIGLAKYGNVVQIRLFTTSDSIEPNVWNVIGTLKDEYKPLVACYETALNANGEPVGWVRIKETGDIDIYHTGSANIKCALGATYITAK